jgi:hypothetical protein
MSPEVWAAWAGVLVVVIGWLLRLEQRLGNKVDWPKLDSKFDEVHAVLAKQLEASYQFKQEIRDELHSLNLKLERRLGSDRRLAERRDDG